MRNDRPDGRSFSCSTRSRCSPSGVGWRQRVRLHYFRPKGPAAPLRRTSVLPEAKSWRRVNSLHPSISISHGIQKEGHDVLSCPSFWSGQRGSNSLPGIPRMAFGHSREPCLTSDLIARFARGWRQRVRLLAKKQDIQLGCPVSIWSGQRGSNSLPPPWQGGALPDELCPREQGIF